MPELKEPEKIWTLPFILVILAIIAFLCGLMFLGSFLQEQNMPSCLRDSEYKYCQCSLLEKEYEKYKTFRKELGNLMILKGCGNPDLGR